MKASNFLQRVYSIAEEALDIAYRAFYASGLGPNPFATAPAIFVNSVTGNDANDGLTAGTAIKTLAELERRCRFVTFLQNTTITLTGDFTAENLVLAEHPVCPLVSC